MLIQRLSGFSQWVLLGIVGGESRLSTLKRRVREESGAMTIEYILIIALIAIIIITLFTILLWPVLRPAIEGLVNRINNAVNGGGIS